MTAALTAFCWGGASGSSLPLMIAFAVLSAIASLAESGEAIWQREFLRIYAASTQAERAAMDAGLGRAAGTFAEYTYGGAVSLQSGELSAHATPLPECATGRYPAQALLWLQGRADLPC